MKYVYVLFEKSTMGDGDCIRAISTRKDNIKKEFNKHKKELLDGGGFDDLELKEDYVCIGYDDGDFVSLEIQKHDII